MQVEKVSIEYDEASFVIKNTEFDMLMFKTLLKINPLNFLLCILAEVMFMNIDSWITRDMLNDHCILFHNH